MPQFSIRPTCTCTRDIATRWHCNAHKIFSFYFQYTLPIPSQDWQEGVRVCVPVAGCGCLCVFLHFTTTTNKMCMILWSVDIPLQFCKYFVAAGATVDLELLVVPTSSHLYCCYNRLTNTFRTRHILPLCLSSSSWSPRFPWLPWLSEYWGFSSAAGKKDGWGSARHFPQW